MQSWNLEKFVKEHDCKTVGIIWGVSHQAVYRALQKKRNIRIILVDGYYHVWEDKLLNKITEGDLKARQHNTY